MVYELYGAASCGRQNWATILGRVTRLRRFSPGHWRGRALGRCRAFGGCLRSFFSGHWCGRKWVLAPRDPRAWGAHFVETTSLTSAAWKRRRNRKSLWQRHLGGILGNRPAGRVLRMVALVLPPDPASFAATPRQVWASFRLRLQLRRDRLPRCASRWT